MSNHRVGIDDVREWLRERRNEMRDRARSTLPHQFEVSRAMKDAMIEYMAMADYPFQQDELIVYTSGGLSYQGIPIVVK